MKNYFALLLLAVPLLFAFREVDNQKSLPSGCFVTASNPGQGLKKTESRLMISFKTNDGRLITDSILMSHNGTSVTAKPDQKGVAWVKVPSGKTKFQFYYNNVYKEIYSDSILLKGAHVIEMEVVFESAKAEVICDKPVIYVYPDVTKHVNIQLNVKGNLGFTYPMYSIPDNNADSVALGWSFTADQNGTLHMYGKEYDYLFWDAKVPTTQFANTSSSGFFVKRDSLVPFFERTLTQMGLNPREQQDFITYWSPLMMKNETSFIHFMFNEEYDSVATINVTPKPDHIFRVFMVWRDADAFKYSEVRTQEIPKANRDGFTVIEWGGGEIPSEFSAQ